MEAAARQAGLATGGAILVMLLDVGEESRAKESNQYHSLFQPRYHSLMLLTPSTSIIPLSPGYPAQLPEHKYLLLKSVAKFISGINSPGRYM